MQSTFLLLLHVNENFGLIFDASLIEEFATFRSDGSTYNVPSASSISNGQVLKSKENLENCFMLYMTDFE